MDPWQFITEGRFQQAVEEYTTLIQSQPKTPYFCNRGIAHLNLGQFNQARSDFESAEQSRGTLRRGDSFLQWIGVVEWLAGRPTEAVKIWHELAIATHRGEIVYSVGAGGVLTGCLLWFAAVRLGDQTILQPAQQFLREQSQKPPTGNWPGPIAQFLLCDITAVQLREHIISVPIRRERQICQAEFYIAVRSLQDGDRVGWANGLERAAQLTAALLEKEYYLARHEGRTTQRTKSVLE